MNIDLFRQELEKLIVECGGRISSPIEITLGDPEKKSYSFGYQPVPFQVVRCVQPLNFHVSISADSFRPWNHITGDDRLLVEELKK